LVPVVALDGSFMGFPRAALIHAALCMENPPEGDTKLFQN
jgi:hypothetical protein